jgi:DNA-binding protein Fis
MELKEFLEKFLPDFNAKELDFTVNELGLHFRIKVESDKFYEKYFPEAIQNFADKLCEKQRENCYGEVLRYPYEIYDEDMKETNLCEIADIVLHDAEQPEIEELIEEL